MAEYRRFLSYVYSYPNGKKEQNTGFVKIEARGRDCRMQFGLQKLPQEETALDVYGFVRQGGILQGIFLGRIPAEQGSAEGVIAAERQQMGGSSIRLEELSGLWLKGEGPADYITVWDDFGVETQKLVLEVAVELEKEAEEEPEAAKSADDAEESGASAQPASVSTEKQISAEPESALEESETSAQPESVSTEKQISAEPESALEESEVSAQLESVSTEKQISAEPERALEESEESAQPENVSTEKQISAEPESALEESEASAQPESVSTEKQISAEPESVSEENEVSEELEKDQKESGGQKKKSGMAAQETVCALPASLCPQIRYCPCGLDYRWECLSRNYAHRRPFALPDIQDCIEISPRDLTALRQPYWCLGRNRFLLRAYGSYQHLLLIQKKDGTVLLGIPGRYDPREARTASAYGFGVFLKAASENARTRFGYWCREVL